METQRSILLATDGTAGSARAIEAAIELDSSLDRGITVVLVVTPPGFPYPVALHGELRAEGRRQLDRATAAIGARRPRVEGVLREGGAAEEIVALARAIDASFVVLGTHGLRGVAHLLMGSVAERVVRTARAPVVTVRSWLYEGRAAAGRELGAELEARGLRAAAPLVLAIDPGGVAVGAEVAHALGRRLGLLATRAIERGGRVVGGAAEGGACALEQEGAGDLEDRLAIDDAVVAAEDEGRSLRGHSWDGHVEGRTVVLVSDGLDAPWPAIAAARALRKQGASRVIMAAPVGVDAATAKLARIDGAIEAWVVPQAIEGALGTRAAYHEGSPAPEQVLRDRLWAYGLGR